MLSFARKTGTRLEFKVNIFINKLRYNNT